MRVAAVGAGVMGRHEVLLNPAGLRQYHGAPGLLCTITSSVKQSATTSLILEIGGYVDPLTPLNSFPRFAAFLLDCHSTDSICADQQVFGGGLTNGAKQAGRHSYKLWSCVRVSPTAFLQPARTFAHRDGSSSKATFLHSSLAAWLDALLAPWARWE